MTDLTPYHLPTLLRTQAKRRHDQIALHYQDNAEWHSLTWEALFTQVDALAHHLLAQGFDSGERVGIFAANSLPWVITDLALMQMGVVSVPIYGTNTAEQTAYIVQDAEIRTLFVGDQAQYEKALLAAEQCPTLNTLILMSDAIQQRESRVQTRRFADLLGEGHKEQAQELAKRQQQVDLEATLTLIYTSGTTGEPKGVILTHRNFAAIVEQHQQVVPLEPGTLSLSFLPLSHIYERGWSLYVLSCGGCNAYLGDPTQVQTAMQTMKPQVMCAVPRLFEKIHTTIRSKVASAGLAKRLLFRWALDQGRRQFRAQQQGRTRVKLGQFYHAIADKLVLSKLRDALGGNFLFVSAGGARLDEKVNAFFQYIGIPLLNGYGATETSATVSCNRLDDIQVNGVGLPLPDVQVRIGEEDEILVKGPTVTPGYFNRPEETEAAFVDGWYKTGDAGYLDNEGRLHITDRIKELMKTSNGKYIAPQRVEGVVALEPLVEQVAIVADGRNFVSALVVPDFLALEQWARQHGLKSEDNRTLVQLPEVQALMKEKIQATQESLAGFEQIKQFTLLPRPFSMDHGELTPTLKLRRKVINEIFADEIDAMYRRRH
ncbi:long-chain fatty acid--CoA ligase [Ferrimonas gelatinilytica]|uniref:Long-chain fatty acid--CoA ligase n=1 Tax=Ferrimonas gelatinilytica TaxID=1255257 RepID=A0ABP9S5W1_9GAMM